MGSRHFVACNFTSRGTCKWQAQRGCWYLDYMTTTSSNPYTCSNLHIWASIKPLVQWRSHKTPWWIEAMLWLDCSFESAGLIQHIWYPQIYLHLTHIVDVWTLGGAIKIPNDIYNGLLMDWSLGAVISEFRPIFMPWCALRGRWFGRHLQRCWHAFHYMTCFKGRRRRLHTATNARDWKFLSNFFLFYWIDVLPLTIEAFFF